MRIPAADRTLAFLGYLPLLFWLPVRFRRRSIFAQFHGRQSFVLQLLVFAVILIVSAIVFFLNQPSPLVSSILFGVIYVAVAYYLLFALIGMVKVLLGERYRMPLVADVALMMRL